MVSVQVDREAVSARDDPQYAPGLARDGRLLAVGEETGVHRLQVRTLAVLDLVEDDVPLERVGTNDVVVAGITVSEDEPGGLVDLPRDGFEPDGEVDVAGGEGLVDAEREALARLVAARLHEHLRASGRGRVLLDRPGHGTAAAGEGGREAARQRADRRILEVQDRHGWHLLGGRGPAGEPHQQGADQTRPRRSISEAREDPHVPSPIHVRARSPMTPPTAITSGSGRRRT